MPRDPRSYRFQIRLHRRHPNGRNTYGAILWREDEARIERCPLAFRVSTAVAKANEFAEKDHFAVAVGTVNARGFWPRFHAEYWVSVPTGMESRSVVRGAR
jgi:hypothetical protein